MQQALADGMLVAGCTAQPDPGAVGHALVWATNALSSGHKWFCMEAQRRDVTKKVRMTRDRADRLAALAEGLGKTESEVLREAVDLMDAQEQKRRAIQALIDMVGPGEKYEKAGIALK